MALSVVAAPAHGQVLPGFVANASKPWTGDLDGMIERRLVRILVVPGKTSYFVDKGVQRGLSYDLGRAFEEELNEKLGRKLLRVEVAFLPVSRDEVLKALVEGRGDIAAANLTVTSERQGFVDFSSPLAVGVKEVVITGPASPEIRTVDDLSGKEIFVRTSSSYFQSLWRLNEEFARAGKPPVIVKPAPEELEDEDILEMLNAGLIGLAIVDDHKVELWRQVLPDIRMHPDVAVRSGGEVAWAMRKDSPQLEKVVNDFVSRHKKGTTFGNMKLRQYLKTTKYVKNSASPEELLKFQQLVDLFKKYAAQYQFDWLMMAAQGYQESQLDQNVKSKVGAIGVMQVMPSTGKELGVGDISMVDPNIHAGTKYLRQVVDRYFSDVDPDDAMLFAFASYNAGPARVARLRKEAKASGLDPDVWFNNVELIAAKRIGQETVRYVGNIYKYYIAYRLVHDTYGERKAVKQMAREPR